MFPACQPRSQARCSIHVPLFTQPRVGADKLTGLSRKNPDALRSLAVYLALADKVRHARFYTTCLSDCDPRGDSWTFFHRRFLPPASSQTVLHRTGGCRFACFVDACAVLFAGHSLASSSRGMADIYRRP